MAEPKLDDHIVGECNRIMKERKQHLVDSIELIAYTKLPEKIISLRSARIQFIDSVNKIPPSQLELPRFGPLDSADPTNEECTKLNAHQECSRIELPCIFPVGGAIPTNEALETKTDELVALYDEFYQWLDTLIYGIRLLYPRLKDGEYIGVELLDQISQMLLQTQESIASRRQELVLYHANRFDKIRNALIYGHLEHYRRLVAVFDQRHCHWLVTMYNKLYRHHVLVHDLMGKVRDKVAQFIASYGSQDDSDVDFSFYN